jgi:uncharacterized repeat protein (TIGR01451 family)
MQVRQWGQRALVRLFMMALATGLLIAAGAGPAHADHIPVDIFAHFDDVSDPGIPGGLVTFEVHAGVSDDPVDFTGPVSITMATPPGTTFYSVSGTLPRAVGGAPGGPPCATPAPGATGTITCSGAFGPEGGPDEETYILMRFRVNADVVVGTVIEGEVSAFVAGNPVPTDSGTEDFEVVAGRAIVSAGPTDEIIVTPDLACQAHHTGDEDYSFYPEFEVVGTCTTALLVQSTNMLYIPDNDASNGDALFTPVSQSLSGTGTPGDPVKIVTVVDAGTSGIRLVQTDSYVVGQPQWRTDVEIVNTTGTPQNVRLYRAADCFLGGSDEGFGQVGPQPGAVACRSETGRLLQWVPLTPGSHYYEDKYSDVFGLVGTEMPFPDTCECAVEQDNGAGLSWDVTVPGNSSVTVSHTTGILVTSVAKTADQPTTPVGQANGYTITVTNYDAAPVSVATITDKLPNGFTYVPGSTTGATTANPSIVAGTLTWAGPFTVPAGTASAPGSLTLHFGVTVATTPGTYTNEASATSAGGTVEITSSGPTAPITVLAKAPQTIVFGPPPVNPAIGGSYTPTATGGGSGNPVVFSIGSGPCSLAGGVVSFTGLGTCVVNADQAGNAGFLPAPQAQQSFLIAKATPTISTVASPGNLVGAPVRDTATLAGGFTPTGNVTFRLFSDAGCNTQVFTSTNALGTPSGWYTPATAGTYRWTATYNGDTNNNIVSGPCNAPNESVTLAPFVAPAYTRIIRNDFMGPVTVNAGESVLIDTNARLVGPVTVQPGGALTVLTAKITGGLTANNPSFLSICGTEIAAPSTGAQALGVSNAAVPIRIGDPASGCAANRFAGTVSLTTNLAVTFGANSVSHPATIDNGGPGNTVIKANTFLGPLGCTGNSPAPINAGQPNTAASKTGQCTGL